MVGVVGVAVQPGGERKTAESRGSAEGSAPPGSWPPGSRLRGCPPRYCLLGEWGGRGRGGGGLVRVQL